MNNKCCPGKTYCMSCALPYQKAGFETDEMYQEYLRNKENAKQLMIKRGHEDFVKKQARSKRLQDILDSAIRSQNYEDYEEDVRSKEWLIERHGVGANLE